MYLILLFHPRPKQHIFQQLAHTNFRYHFLPIPLQIQSHLFIKSLNDFGIASKSRIGRARDALQYRWSQRTKDACTREAERDNGKTRCARNEGRNGVFVAMGGEGRPGAYVGVVRDRDIEFTPFLF